MTQKEKDLLKTIFWDTDINKLDLQNHKRYTIERILQYGFAEHINWMLKHFQAEDIINAVKNSKSIDKKTANYWSIRFKINKNEILCFTRQLVMSNSMF